MNQRDDLTYYYCTEMPKQNNGFILSILLIVVVLIGCTSTATEPKQKEPSKISIDTALIGKWEAVNHPVTLELSQKSKTEGEGIRRALDQINSCKNGQDYIDKVFFNWKQVEKNSGISVIKYEEKIDLRCGRSGIDDVVTYNMEYKFKGDTLFFGMSVFKYLKVE